MEVVRLVGTYGHEACGHGEAVEVARDVAVHVRQFVGVEVVACREAEVPVFRGLYTSVETEVLRQFSFVFHLLFVEFAVAVVD